MKPIPEMKLTLSQQFELRRMEDESTNLSKEELRSILLKAMRLMFIKDNMIKDLIKTSHDI